MEVCGLRAHGLKQASFAKATAGVLAALKQTGHVIEVLTSGGNAVHLGDAKDLNLAAPELATVEIDNPGGNVELQTDAPASLKRSM